MRIINQTKQAVLAEEAIVADTPLRRAKGLLGKKEFKPGQALLLRPCNSIHTFFMRFPIDVLFVDRNNKIVQVIPHLGPFRLTPVYFHACFAVELPAGTITAALISKGDILIIE